MPAIDPKTGKIIYTSPVKAPPTPAVSAVQVLKAYDRFTTKLGNDLPKQLNRAASFRAKLRTVVR